MEIPQGYVTELKVHVPVNSAVKYIFKRHGEPVGVEKTAIPEDNVINVLTPVGAVAETGDLTLEITFSSDGTEYTLTEQHKVYRPYLSLLELREIMDFADDDECWEIERAVRAIIDEHTTQNFGYEHKTITMLSNPSVAMSLPERLERLDRVVEGSDVVYDITSNPPRNVDAYIVTGDGWFLKRPGYSPAPLSYTTTDPIRVRPRSRSGFRNDVKYKITGVWGYAEVPSAVREAAKLLVNDYACQDSTYRDRYIKSVRSGDWRLEFHDGAFVDTGNARANTLLRPYVVQRMVVL